MPKRQSSFRNFSFGLYSVFSLWFCNLALIILFILVPMCRLLVLGVTTYDIHRSIEANQIPPSKEQVAALTAQIEESRHSGDSSPKGS